MKKLILILVVAVFLAGMFVSCSHNTCPAYSYDDDTEQVEKNV